MTDPRGETSSFILTHGKQLQTRQLTDHFILAKKINLNGFEFNLISLNIAQKDRFRTMSKFNTVTSYLRTKKSIEKTRDKKQQALKTTHQISKEFDPDVPDGMITESEAQKDPNTPSGRLFAMAREKYKTKGLPLAALVINKKNKKNPIDAYFQQETDDAYRSRIAIILKTLDKLAGDTIPSILCLQEINPLDQFISVLEGFTDFHLIHHPSMDARDTNSITITKNWPFRIIPHERCALKDVLGKKKNKSQLLEYHIPELQSTLFNIHGAYTYMNQELAKSIYDAIKSYNTNIFIVGDFNFTSQDPKKTTQRKEFQDRLNQFSFYVALAPTPEIAFNPDLSQATYDGFIIKKRPILSTMREIIF